MKKLFLALLILVSLLGMNTFGILAQVQAAAEKDSASITKVLIDKKVVTLKQNPVILNGEVYFPLNSALLATGISNDGKTVKIGKGNKDITITKGSLKVYAKVNSNSVTINKKQVTLKAPVVVKSGILYLPAGLINKYSGKLVIYSSTLKTVSVISEAEYKKVESFFKQVDSSFKKLKDCSYKVNFNMDMEAAGMKFQYNTKASGTIDAVNKIISAVTSTATVSPMGKEEENSESYKVNGKYYVKTAGEDTWAETEEGEDISMVSGFLEGFDSGDTSDDPDYDAVMNSSCILTTDKSGAVTTVKSSMFIDLMMQDYQKELFTDGKPSAASMTFSVDNKTKFIKACNITMSGNISADGINMKASIKVDMSYENFNKCNAVTLPSELEEYISSGKKL